MDPSTEKGGRRLIRLRGGTWFCVLGLISCWIGVAARGRFGRSPVPIDDRPPIPMPPFEHGWPLPFLERSNWLPAVEEPASFWPIDNAEIFWFALGYCVFDAVVFLLSVVCAAFVLESYFRGRASAYRFSLRTILILTLLAGLILYLIRSGQIDWIDLMWLPVGFSVLAIFYEFELGLTWLIDRHRTQDIAP